MTDGNDAVNELDEMDGWPLTAPGMSLPGGLLVESAYAANDPKLVIAGKGKEAQLVECGPVLQTYFNELLYSPDNIPIGRTTGTRREYQRLMFHAGHIWKPPCEDFLAMFGAPAMIPLGPQRAEVMVIGKMPGIEEVKTGRNFSGPSGEHLEQALTQLGICREDYSGFYVTNVVKYIPPSGKAVSKADIRECAALLDAEIRLVKPRFILCLGVEAIQSILGEKVKAVTAAGRVHELKTDLRKDRSEPEQWLTSQVVCCTHPAAILRNPAKQPLFLQELSVFTNLFKTKTPADLVLDTSGYQFISNSVDLSYLVHQILESGCTAIALDAEWHGDHPGAANSYLRTIQFSWAEGKACSVILTEAGGKPCFSSTNFTDDYDIVWAVEPLKKLFLSEKVRLVGHFVRADIPWLCHFGVDLRDRFSSPGEDLGDLLAFERTRTEGGFDTALAAHSVYETLGSYKLEVLASMYLGMPRYDVSLLEWRADYCRKNRLKAEGLEGYGMCPSEVLHPYGAADADATLRLFHLFNGSTTKPGLLDQDSFGLCSREAFWRSMRAFPAFLEMEMTGLLFDQERCDQLCDLYEKVYTDKLEEFRTLIQWPDFNPGSDQQRKEWLFGEEFNGKKRTEDGVHPRLRPEGCESLRLTPIKTTGTRQINWLAVQQRDETSEYAPACDRETLSLLAQQKPVVRDLLNLRFLAHIFSSVLKHPQRDKVSGELVLDEGNDRIYTGGLPAAVWDTDGRIHTTFYQTKETGRASSARPPLQNISKKREADFVRILGKSYLAPLRSCLRASPGHCLIEADFKGAEIAAAAWLSGDVNLIDHVRRMNLKSSHPDHYDPHSNTAVAAFGLKCHPSKKGLAEAGVEYLRDAAKAVFFGFMYGQGAESAAMKSREVTERDVSVQECDELQKTMIRRYPQLNEWFQFCRKRVTRTGAGPAPRWLCNSFGRYRRFAATFDRLLIGEQQREAMNFPVQSTIADAMSAALDNLYYRRKLYPATYRIVLQVHDAVILEVPYDSVACVWERVLPECMVDLNPIFPCDLSGVPLGSGPYHLEIDKHAYTFWGDNDPKLKEMFPFTV